MSTVIQMVKRVSQKFITSFSAVLPAGFSCFAFAFTNSFEPALESSAVNKRVFLYLLVFVSES